MKNSTLKIKSLMSNIHKLEKFIEDICDDYNINNTYFGTILVAVAEAVENSIIHGNKYNEKKQIKITFSSDDKGLCFMVEDEGEGFDITKIPDATDTVNNPEKKGTGIFIIKSLADDIEFRDYGKKVIMKFHISSINQQIASKRENLLNQYFKVDMKEKERKN